MDIASTSYLLLIKVCSFIYLILFFSLSLGWKKDLIVVIVIVGVVVTVLMPKWCRGGSIESI